MDKDTRVVKIIKDSTTFPINYLNKCKTYKQTETLTIRETILLFDPPEDFITWFDKCIFDIDRQNINNSYSLKDYQYIRALYQIYVIMIDKIITLITSMGLEHITLLKLTDSEVELMKYVINKYNENSDTRIEPLETTLEYFKESKGYEGRLSTNAIKYKYLTLFDRMLQLQNVMLLYR